MHRKSGLEKIFKKYAIQVFVAAANEEFNLTLLYYLHVVIQATRREWAASQVLEDHMAIGCGGVWAVVSFSVPLFAVKGPRGGGGRRDYIYTRTRSLF